MLLNLVFSFLKYPFQIGVFAHSSDKGKKIELMITIYKQQFDRKKLYRKRDIKTDLEKLWPFEKKSLRWKVVHSTKMIWWKFL